MTNQKSQTVQISNRANEDAQTRSAYQRYFNSGYYDQRYPTPNRSMWRRIKKLLKSRSRVLDYGCGSGRYLFALRGFVDRAIGFDISPAALALVRERASRIKWDELSVVGPSTKELEDYISNNGQVDLILCLFGVLGHITDPAERASSLQRMHRALDPNTGRLLISVPNIARRFRKEQRDGVENGLVSYSREINGAPMHLNYQLFDPERFLRELETAGFQVHCIKAESVFPESYLLHSVTARWLDSFLTPICPKSWGYGLVAEASP